MYTSSNIYSLTNFHLYFWIHFVLLLLLSLFLQTIYHPSKAFLRLCVTQTASPRQPSPSSCLFQSDTLISNSSGPIVSSVPTPLGITSMRHFLSCVFLNVCLFILSHPFSPLLVPLINPWVDYLPDFDWRQQDVTCCSPGTGFLPAPCLMISFLLYSYLPCFLLSVFLFVIPNPTHTGRLTRLRLTPHF